jgi:hypothetical protein
VARDKVIWRRIKSGGAEAGWKVIVRFGTGRRRGFNIFLS